MKEKNIPIKDALRSFHSSETYRRLSDPKTGYWRTGQVGLYNEFIAELK